MTRLNIYTLLVALMLLPLDGIAWEVCRYETSLLQRIAQEREQVVAKRNWWRTDDPYTFAFGEIIAPAALIVVGSSSQYIKAVEQVDEYINDITQYGQSRLTFDDYLQYSPYLMLWTLDACGVKSRHGFKEQTTNLIVSLAVMGAVVNIAKYTIQRQRPNGSMFNSMPSGHTAMAFTGAEFLRMEFAPTSPWIGVAGYAIATTTATMRIYNNRHYLTDTLVGAGVGILSVRAAYWIAPWLNRALWGSELRADKSPVTATITPYADALSYGASMQLKF